MHSSSQHPASQPAHDAPATRIWRPIARWALAAVLDALAVLFPVDCAGCGSMDRSLCESCRRKTDPDVQIHHTPAGLAVHTALVYDGHVRTAILALKENGRTDIARYFVRPLTAAVTAAGVAVASGGHPQLPDASTREIEVVTVPGSVSAWRRRGYDPVALMCGRRLRRSRRILAITASSARQKTLGELGRASNVRGIMRARRTLVGRYFVLVDDVLTTGSTLDEAARALTAAGGVVVAAATLAFTPRIFAPRHTP